MHMILKISTHRKERDMKRNKTTKKTTTKTRRAPLYFVDNPHNLELNWLDDIQQSNDKPISVQGIAAAVEPSVESQAESRQGRVNANAKAKGKVPSKNAPAAIRKDADLPAKASSELLSTEEEAEYIVAVADSEFEDYSDQPPEDNEQENMQDIVEVVEFLENETQQSTDALAALLSEETEPEIEFERNDVPEVLETREILQSKLDEKRMPYRPAPIVYTDDLVDEAITGSKIAPFAVRAAHMAADSIHSNSLADFAVTSIKLADGSVTSSKLAPESIVSDHLTKNAISGQKIRDRSITGEKLRDGSVSSEKLADRTIAARRAGVA